MGDERCSWCRLMDGAGVEAWMGQSRLDDVDDVSLGHELSGEKHCR